MAGAGRRGEEQFFLRVCVFAAEFHGLVISHLKKATPTPTPTPSRMTPSRVTNHSRDRGHFVCLPSAEKTCSEGLNLVEV